ncbi:glycosyltransferase family 4 protein [Halomonas llamarensis]|uniref:Glycosyltransferase family 1 protein n=1 Tax=Halomonas llamarensis TaxID=2945104 RepID=A0ABT0SQZ0_9GAMM|nr:glycosyltransferase family 1 protein [Halomonas llamarensis]MCL7929983.1 glycosyltransferase family 1 protein [Halomonas llamarensis]
MRLCIVSETWAPEINGVAHTLRRLSHELARLGVTVDLVRPRPQNAAAGQTASVDTELHTPSMPLPGYRDVKIGLTTPARMRRFFLAQRPDVVYLATQGPLGWAARQAALRLHIPIVAGWHTNFDHYCHSYGLGFLATATKRYLRYFHNDCALTLVPTQAQTNALRGDGIHHVQVLSRGIDGDKFSPELRDVDLRRQWGVNDHQPVVLYVGRLAAEKNLTLLQETLHAMRSVCPDMAQVIVGDGPARTQLQKALPDAHFTGFLPPEALSQYYASADIFLFPSLSETWGNVVTEAMASGLAVVAYQHAASAELIHHGHNGLTLTVGDNDAFRQAAVLLCQRPADYARFGRLARLRALEQSWTGIARQLLTYLHQAQEAYHATSPPCRIRSS